MSMSMNRKDTVRETNSLCSDTCELCNKCGYAVCCCSGDLDYYFYWGCPGMYDWCMKYFYNSVDTSENHSDMLQTNLAVPVYK